MDDRLQHQIDSFVALSEGRGCIVVYGPTACGKTSLSIEIARYLQSEVISVDARQVYRGMDIGTGKVTAEEMGDIVHHMIDVVDPSDPYSVVDYERAAAPILTELRDAKKTPTLCGGTGLYIDSLIYERRYMGNPPDPVRRQALEDYRQHMGNEALWQKLYEIDPDYARELHPNNHTYIIRAIEVYEDTGRSKKDAEQPLTLKRPTLFVTPYDGDRDKLYTRINDRVKGMFDTGLVEEVGYIIEKFGRECPGLATIGYSEVADYLDGSTSLDRAIELVQQHSRNYAKRQLTWNKKYATANTL